MSYALAFRGIMFGASWPDVHLYSRTAEACFAIGYQRLSLPCARHDSALKTLDLCVVENLIREIFCTDAYAPTSNGLLTA
jgi:hypothetical protein